MILGGSDVTEIVDARTSKERRDYLDTCQHLAEGQFLTTTATTKVLFLMASFAAHFFSSMSSFLSTFPCLSLRRIKYFDFKTLKMTVKDYIKNEPYLFVVSSPSNQHTRLDSLDLGFE